MPCMHARHISHVRGKLRVSVVFGLGLSTKLSSREPATKHGAGCAAGAGLSRLQANASARNAGAAGAGQAETGAQAAPAVRSSRSVFASCCPPVSVNGQRLNDWQAELQAWTPRSVVPSHVVGRSGPGLLAPLCADPAPLLNPLQHPFCVHGTLFTERCSVRVSVLRGCPPIFKLW